MIAPAVEGIDLFKIAGRSISGWMKSLKTGTASHVRQPFCSQLEERLLLWLEYYPQVASYARGDIGTPFATTYRLPTPKDAPFANRTLPLALLSPDAAPLVPDPLPDTLLPEPAKKLAIVSLESSVPVPGPTFDASTLDEKQREHFHRNLRAVEQVLAGAPQTRIAEKEGIPRSTLGCLVRRTRELGQIACVPHGSYRRSTTMHPAFQECIRRLYLLLTQMSMAALHEHTEMQQVANRLSAAIGAPVKLPSYKQVRTEVHRLKMEPELVAVREGAKSIPRARESQESFALSIPAPALLTQVDEHSLELYVVTPDGIAVTERVHAAVLVCVKKD